MPPYCIIHDDIARAGLRKPLATHVCYSGEGKERTPNRCCEGCWRHWFASQVESVPWNEIHCIFCSHKLGRDEMKALGADDGTLVRYTMKRDAVPEFKCQARCNGPDTASQSFDREKDGRVFTCNDCKFQTCVDCDRPEHPDKTCEEIQFRLRNDPAEIATVTSTKWLMCPECGVTGEPDGGCGYIQCVGTETLGGCGHRFCSHCRINWVGDKSAYAGGQAAHANDCPYRNRGWDSTHNLTHRFQLSDEAEKKKKEKAAKAKAYRAKAKDDTNKVTKVTSARKTAKAARK